MATPAISAGGTKTTDTPCVSSVKQFNTYYQPASNYQKWNNASFQQFG
jgi:hypothetical protein